MSEDKLPIAVLVSGNGSNLQAIIDASACGSINAAIKVVISNRADVFAIHRAIKAKIPTEIVAYSEGKEKAEHQMASVIKKHDCKLIVLAGFMRILSPEFVNEFKNRMINLHPSLLPLFPGMDSIRQAFDAGADETGATVHFVDEGCDTGQIILQEKIKIEKNDTLATLTEKVHAIEHRILPKAIDLFAKNKVKLPAV